MTESDRPGIPRDRHLARSDLLRSLCDTSQAITDAGDAAQVGQALMAFAAQAGVDAARLFLFVGEPAGPRWIEMREGWSVDGRPAQPYGTRLPLDDSYPLLRFMRPDQPLVVEDVAGDERMTDPARMMMAISGLGSFAVLPLRAARGEKDGSEEWLGAFFVGCNTATTFSEEMISTARALAGQAASAIQHWQEMGQRLQAQASAQRRALDLQLAAEISKAASSVLDLDELIRQAVDLIRDRFGLYYVGLFLVQDEPELSSVGLTPPASKTFAVLRAGTGEAGRQLVAERHRLEVGGQSMIGWCIEHTQACLVPDASLEDGQSARSRNPLLPDTRSELALPLVSRGRAVGALTIQSTEEEAFSQEDITALQTMADQLANAIGNAQLFRERERRLAEIAVVSDIGQALSSALELDDLLDMVYQQVGRLFDTTNFYIATYEEGSDEWNARLHVENGVRQPPAWYSLEAGLTGHVLRTRQPLVFHNLDENQAFQAEHRLQAIGELARSWLGVPLIAAEKRVGVMGIQDYERDNQYGERELALLATVGGQVAVAIDNLRLLDTTRRRARELEAINEVGRATTSVLDLDTVLRQIVDVTKERFDSYFVSLLLLEGSRLVYRAGSTIGQTGVRLEAGSIAVDLAAGTGLTAEAFRSGRPVLVHDVAHDSRYLVAPELAATRSELDVPIRVKGQVIGVLDMQADRPHAYDEEIATVFQSLADQAGVAIENARLFQESGRRTTELQALYSIALRLGSQLETRDLLQLVVEQSVALLDAETGGFYLYEAETGDLVFSVAVGFFHRFLGSRLKPGEGLAGQVFATRHSQRIKDYQAWQGRAAAYAEEERLHGVLAVPVLGRERVLGVLDIGAGPHKPIFDEHDVWLAELFAAQAATALDTALLFEKSEQEAAASTRLYRAGQDLTAARDLDGIMAAILETTRPLDVDRCLIALLEDPAAPPVERSAIVQSVWDRHGREAIYLGNHFGVGHIPVIAALGPADRLVVEDFAQPPSGDLVDDQTRATFQMLGVGAAAILPLAVGGRLLGWLLVETIGRPRQFADRDLDALQSIAGQSAVIMDNLRLLGEMRDRAQELQVLNEVGRAVTSVLDLDQVLRQIVDITKERFGYYFVGIALVEEEAEAQTGPQIVFRSGSRIGDTGQRLSTTPITLDVADAQSLVAEVARTGQPVLVNDVLADPRYMAVPELAATRAELDVPIVARGRIVGVLTVQADRPFGQTGSASAKAEAAIRPVQALADQVGVAIDNVRLFENAQRAEVEQRQRSEELDILNEMGRAVSGELSLQAVVETIHRYAARVISDGATNLYVALYDAERDIISFPLFAEGETRRHDQDRSPGQGLTEYILRTREPVLILDNLEQWVAERGVLSIGQTAKSWLGVPMLIGERVTGVVAVQSYTTPRVYDEHDRDLLVAIASQAAIAIENARLFEGAQVRAQEMDVLNEMGRALGQAFSAQQVAQAVYEHAARLLGDRAANLFIALCDDKSDMIYFPIYIQDGQRIERTARPRGRGLTEHVVQTRQPLFLRERVEEERKALGIDLIGQQAESWLGVPMVIGERVLGVLVVQSYTTPRLFTNHDRDLVLAIAGQAAVAFESARLFEEQQRTSAQLGARVRHLDCLNDIGRHTAGPEAPSIPDFLAWLTGRLPQAMQHADMCVAAAEWEGQVYGAAEALGLPHQMAASLGPGRQQASHSRIVVAYREDREFLDEESALLGDIVRRVSGYIENRQLLEETEQTASQLAREQALLRTMIDNLPDLIYVKDERSRFLINNHAQLAALGAHTQEEVLGRTDFDYFPEEIAAGFYADEQALFASGQPLLGREEYVLDEHGQKRWLSTTKVPLRDSQGRITGLVGIGRDITTHIQAEEALRRRGAQLQCLSDIGQRIAAAPAEQETETPTEGMGGASMAEFMTWLTERLPAAMQYPELCVVAVQIEGQLYGSAEALDLPCQMAASVGSGRAGSLDLPSGRIVIAYREDREFLNEESALLGEVVRRVEGYLDNRRLIDQVQAALAEARNLYDASRRLATADDLQTIVDAIVSPAELAPQLPESEEPSPLEQGPETRSTAAEIGETSEVPRDSGSRKRGAINRAIIWSMERDQAGETVALVSAARWYAGWGTPPLPVGTRFPLAHFPAMQTVLAADPQFVDDIATDPRLDPATRATLVAQNAHGLAMLPMWVGRRQVGLLMLVTETQHQFSEQEVRYYRQLVDQVAVAVDNRHLLEETQTALTRTEALYQASAELSAASTYDAALTSLRRHTLLAGADRGVTIELFDRPWTEDDMPEWATAIARYTEFPTEIQTATYSLRGSPVARLLQFGQPTIVEDTSTDPRLGEEARELYEQQYSARSMITMPLMVGGQWVGIVEALFAAPSHFAPDEIQRLSILCGQTAVVVQGLRQFEQVQAALAEVEATHQRYMRGRWQAYLREHEAFLQTGYVYDRERDEATAIDVAELEFLASDLAPHPEAEQSGAASRHARLAVPIALRGQTIGVLGIEDPDQARSWSDDDVALLEEVGQQLALALENARLFEETQRRAERERLVTDITARIRASTDILGVLETTATELGRALGTSRAVVKLAPEEPAQGGSPSSSQRTRPLGVQGPGGDDSAGNE